MAVNRVFFWMNSIHGPFVIPELINTTCPEKSSTLYAIFSQKNILNFNSWFFFCRNYQNQNNMHIWYMYNWSGEQKFPILKTVKKKKKRVILTKGCEIFAMYENVPLQWIAGKESPICCVSVCLLVDIDSWCDVYRSIINKS